MKKVFQTTQCLSKELLDGYVKGSLSEDLRFQVENHLLDCPLCEAAVEGFSEMQGEDHDALFDQVLEDIDAKTMKVPSAKQATRTKIPWNNIAAGLCLLIVAGAAFWYLNSSTPASYLSYFEDQESSWLTRSMADERIPQDLKSGLALYAKESYPASLSFFEDYLEEHPESGPASYYAGMSALEHGTLTVAHYHLSRARMNHEDWYDMAITSIAGHIYSIDQTDAFSFPEFGIFTVTATDRTGRRHSSRFQFTLKVEPDGAGKIIVIPNVLRIE